MTPTPPHFWVEWFLGHEERVNPEMDRDTAASELLIHTGEVIFEFNSLIGTQLTRVDKNNHFGGNYKRNLSPYEINVLTSSVKKISPFIEAPDFISYAKQGRDLDSLEDTSSSRIVDFHFLPSPLEIYLNLGMCSGGSETKLSFLWYYDEENDWRTCSDPVSQLLCLMQDMSSTESVRIWGSDW
jgi:hypothetical protein